MATGTHGGLAMKVCCAMIGGKSGSEAAYSLLEYAVGREYGLSALPEIKRGRYGKPYFPGWPDIHFSLSHARTHVLCAVSSCPVGCDIESPRIISRRTVEYFGSAAELADFEPLELWVLKESYVKLLGLTVASVRKLRFSRDGGKISVAGGECAVPPASFRQYRIGACSAAACSFEADPPGQAELVPV